MEMLELYSEDSEYIYDEKQLKKALKYFNKYKTGDEKIDKEFFDDLMKNVRKYRITSDIEEFIEVVRYQYQVG